MSTQKKPKCPHRFVQIHATKLASGKWSGRGFTLKLPGVEMTPALEDWTEKVSDLIEAEMNQPDHKAARDEAYSNAMLNAVFYGDEPDVDEMLADYRRILKRLREPR